MTTVYLLMRHDDEDPPALIRSYESYQVAHAAHEKAIAHLTSPERPQAPGTPSGLIASSVVGVHGTLYGAPGGQMVNEATSRQQYPDEWALYDARKAAYHWWLQANPVDPGAPEGSAYTVTPVEHESR
jgi:hypothetical protein